MTKNDFVLVESADGWSLHAPGSTDEQIACGDAPPLVDGAWETDDHIVPADAYLKALVRLPQSMSVNFMKTTSSGYSDWDIQCDTYADARELAEQLVNDDEADEATIDIGEHREYYSRAAGWEWD